MIKIDSDTWDEGVEILATPGPAGDVYIRLIGDSPHRIPAAELRRALDIEVPQGSWDDKAGGGVAASAIEREDAQDAAVRWMIRAKDAEEQQDVERARADAAEGNLAVMQVASLEQEARTLAPEGITKVMVQRAVDAYNTSAQDSYARFADMDAALAAALTEPPQRSEDAEAIGELIEESLSGDALSDAQVQALADFLADRGVRARGATCEAAHLRGRPVSGLERPLPRRQN